MAAVIPCTPPRLTAARSCPDAPARTRVVVAPVVAAYPWLLAATRGEDWEEDSVNGPESPPLDVMDLVDAAERLLAPREQHVAALLAAVRLELTYRNLYVPTAARATWHADNTTLRFTFLTAVNVGALAGARGASSLACTPFVGNWFVSVVCSA